MIIHCTTDKHVEVPFENLVNAKLEGLDLHRAELEEVNLSGSSFKNSNLRGLSYIRQI